MTPLIPIIALILSLAGESATIDKGRADGLLPGDQGAIFYTLKVGEQIQRIEVGIAEVSTVEDFRAQITFLQKSAAIRKYSVEFQVPSDRVTPDELLRLARLRLSEGKSDVVEKYLERLAAHEPLDRAVARAAEELRSQAENPMTAGRESASPEAGSNLDRAQSNADILREARRDPPILQRKSEIKNDLKHREMAYVGSGTFEIGLDAEAQYYNERPRFAVRLEGFWIDRRPVDQSGVTHEEAEAYCASLGKRLPTEFEWEAAASANVILGVSDAEEWTSSWYRPYPGNRVRETEYGEKFKVVRGFSAIYRRRFMAPNQTTANLTFRCACE